MKFYSICFYIIDTSSQRDYFIPYKKNDNTKNKFRLIYKSQCLISVTYISDDDIGQNPVCILLKEQKYPPLIFFIFVFFLVSMLILDQVTLGLGLPRRVQIQKKKTKNQNKGGEVFVLYEQNLGQSSVLLLGLGRILDTEYPADFKYRITNNKDTL